MIATENDHILARSIAEKTGKLLVTLREKLSSQGISGKELKDAGDQAAHNFIVQQLEEARPSDIIFSEEGEDPTKRLNAERVWIVDPLDGTREFSEPPRTDWAVHIALVHDNKPIAGSVSLPAQENTLSSVDEYRLPPFEGKPRLMVSRTRKPEPIMALAEALGAECVEMGSAGAKTMHVVQGHAEIYAHTGGQYEWDSCAPVAIAQAAGLHCSRLDGSPLLYNQTSSYLPDLLICRTELAEPALEFLNETIK